MREYAPGIVPCQRTPTAEWVSHRWERIARSCNLSDGAKLVPTIPGRYPNGQRSRCLTITRRTGGEDSGRRRDAKPPAPNRRVRERLSGTRMLCDFYFIGEPFGSPKIIRRGDMNKAQTSTMSVRRIAGIAAAI